jgi:hypothetical protein
MGKRVPGFKSQAAITLREGGFVKMRANLAVVT